MGLREQIEEDIKISMRRSQADPKEKVRLSTLRLLLAEIKNVEIEKRKVLEESEIIEIIGKQIKRRKESIEGFAKGGRSEMADKEKEEMEMLLDYMPEQLTDGEIKAVVLSSIAELSLGQDVNTGLVMKAVMAKLKGRADGRVVSELVNKALSSKD